MTDDDRTPVILDTSAPPDSGYVLQVAEAIPEAFRVLNEQTLHREALQEPQDAHQVILDLAMAHSREPQLLDQLAIRLAGMAARGEIRADGEDPLPLLIASVRLRADKARGLAEELHEALSSLAVATSHLKAAGEGSDG